MKDFRSLVPVAMLGFALTASSSVLAQSNASPPAGMNNPAAPDSTVKATAPGTPGSQGSFSGWMTDYSKANQGRISRQAYMDEAGRRWDSADKNNQGLTNAEINRMYGTGTAGSNNSMNKDNKGN